ncbi:hypothetical protein FOXG_18517 [Fusarium oxysporum f. sp. lycopersici 4287]|uniref:Uncharacterized protein n=2 Tax=Fusarium oxysporum TaxID=5507 RepID=A0A0J9WIV9_FUSO4|nr:hypothetical protein FOXG_18517 [Fusarium oxysporum f. sp. lycopersici 4287]EXK34432.1 hypothetical protein FOMG_11392 [Fusarium oxysporum f. sp. melonis 26406]KNA99211.1 hypothetical protein FOXG_18517 [Fusarium oxysporum f. sp. lycopersici 4287]
MSSSNCSSLTGTQSSPPPPYHRPSRDATMICAAVEWGIIGAEPGQAAGEHALSNDKSTGGQGVEIPPWDNDNGMLHPRKDSPLLLDIRSRTPDDLHQGS